MATTQDVEGITDELGNSTIGVRYLQAKEDAYGGIIVDILSFKTKDVFTFVDSLHLSLQRWRIQKKKGVWLELPTEYSIFVHPAIQEGFTYHHAETTYVMLVHWLPDEPSTLPPNASHQVGIGAFVSNDRQEILVVQERYGVFQGKWKMPSGVIHQGEDVFSGAIREVKEETGIDTKFVEVIGFRQAHKIAFGKSDLFFMCILRPLTSKISVQKSELADAKWMSLAEYKEQEYLSERKMLKKMLDACIEAIQPPCKGFRVDNVHAGTDRTPQYFYNNSGT